MNSETLPLDLLALDHALHDVHAVILKAGDEPANALQERGPPKGSPTWRVQKPYNPVAIHENLHQHTGGRCVVELTANSASAKIESGPGISLRRNDSEPEGVVNAPARAPGLPGACAPKRRRRATAVALGLAL